jgi:hypothetical protein
MQTSQATVTAIPAGTPVQTPSGRRAVTVTDSLIVRNSETGLVTATNLIKFSDDDEVCPGGEWSWNTRKLTVLPEARTLRLIDPSGYTVVVRDLSPADDADEVRQQLLCSDAVADAEQWTAWGFKCDARLYRVVSD